MALASHRTDGYTLTVFSTLYMDWGLEIRHKGGVVFYNSCFLANDSYGRKPAPEFEDYDAAEQAALEGNTDAFVPWEEEDWKNMLVAEADSLLEMCLQPTHGTASAGKESLSQGYS